MRYIIHSSFLIFLLCIAQQAQTRGKQDFQEPVHISSGKQEIKLDHNTLVFYENVKINQGTIIIHADKVIIKQMKASGRKYIEAFGQPTTFSQIMDNGERLFAQALKIDYNPSAQTIHLQQNAHVQQQDSKVYGENIFYQVAEGTITAHGSQEKDRVQSIFSFHPENAP